MVTIIAYLTHSSRTLKACSLTCRSWHIPTVPHLHRTLNLRERTPKSRGKLKPLFKLHGLGLAPLVEEVRVTQQWLIADPWFVPRAFSHRDLCSFSAFANVQTLMFRGLVIDRFIPGIERYFEQFSPALRSITLWDPRCTPRQLSYFLSFFKPRQYRNPADSHIRIQCNHPRHRTRSVFGVEISGAFDTSRISLGRNLEEPCCFVWWPTVRPYEHEKVVDHAPILLEACAKTLETLRLDTTGDVAGIIPSHSYHDSRPSDPYKLWLDRLPRKWGRSPYRLQGGILDYYVPKLVHVLKVIGLVYLPSDFALFMTLQTTNEDKSCKLAFLFEVSDWLQGEA